MNRSSRKQPTRPADTQTRESGEAGRLFGLRSAAYVSEQLNADLLSSGSNEVLWAGKRAVIKSCGPKTTSYGVPVAVLERIDLILAAFVTDSEVEIWKLTVEDFQKGMRDSLSKSAKGGRVKQNTKAFTWKHGLKVTTLPLPPQPEVPPR